MCARAINSAAAGAVTTKDEASISCSSREMRPVFRSKASAREKTATSLDLCFRKASKSSNSDSHRRGNLVILFFQL
jgi:hypothetical protein